MGQALSKRTAPPSPASWLSPSPSSSPPTKITTPARKTPPTKTLYPSRPLTLSSNLFSRVPPTFLSLFIPNHLRKLFILHGGTVLPTLEGAQLILVHSLDDPLIPTIYLEHVVVYDCAWIEESFLRGFLVDLSGGDFTVEPWEFDGGAEMIPGELFGGLGKRVREDGGGEVGERRVRARRGRGGSLPVRRFEEDEDEDIQRGYLKRKSSSPAAKMGAFIMDLVDAQEAEEDEHFPSDLDFLVELPQQYNQDASSKIKIKISPPKQTPSTRRTAEKTESHMSRPTTASPKLLHAMTEVTRPRPLEASSPISSQPRKKTSSSTPQTRIYQDDHPISTNPLIHQIPTKANLATRTPHAAPTAAPQNSLKRKTEPTPSSRPTKQPRSTSPTSPYPADLGSGAESAKSVKQQSKQVLQTRSPNVARGVVADGQRRGSGGVRDANGRFAKPGPAAFVARS